MAAGDDLGNFLRHEAAPALIGVIGDATARAEADGRRTSLAHVLDRLLEEESVRSRLDDHIRGSARATLADQIAALPRDQQQAGKFAFRLTDFAVPACALARDSGSTKVTPLIFLGACLAASLDVDPESGKAREALRVAGLTHELLLPSPSRDQVRRADFTFQSLGFGTDITAMARAGFWTTCPLVGMTAELRRLAIVLSSMNYSAAVVGEPGVGKSAFIQGFAWHIVHRTRPLIPPDMDSWTVVMIEAVDVLKGTSGRGELETRVKEMLAFFRQNPTVVPFFEEVHRLLDTDDTSSRSVATALKPPMANGLFRCAGVTTDKEYARFIASDEAMNSRFRKILLPEPDLETAVQIVRGAKSNLLHSKARELGIDFDDSALKTAVRVTSTYQKSDRLPRKAIILISETLSQKLYDVVTGDGATAVSRMITADDVARFFSDVSGIPIDDLDDDRGAYYLRLQERLNTRVVGQPHVIEAVTGWLALHANGWVDPRRPRGRFLFLGPPGVGKTELATCLAEEVMRDRGSVITFNMADFKGDSARNRFVGADPGYIGFGQTPTIFSKVMMRPYSVVILDEIEKADPSIADALIGVLDGRGEDSQGRAVDFSQCIFVMTSNAIGVDPGTLGEGSTEGGQRSSRLDQALRHVLIQQGGIWTPPLVDRIDRVALFDPLNADTLARILDATIAARRQFTRRPLPLELDTSRAREEILSAAREGSAISARRLERALQAWLAEHAKRDSQPLPGGEPAAATGT